MEIGLAAGFMVANGSTSGMQRTTYPVCEQFISLQGEGLSLGRKSCFIRLAGCNLSCTFCDTAYARDVGSAPRLDVPTILRAAPHKMPIIITGGEPMLYDLEPLLRGIYGRDGRDSIIEIETNGTIFTPYYHVQFVVSPKLDFPQSYKRQVIKAFEEHGAIFKFVIRDRADFEHVMDIHDALWLSEIVLMPEGTTAKGIIQRSRDIAQWMCAEERDLRNVRLIPRLHTLLWGATRGR
ncbi:MAG: 7-carboxy-7-deazaguanine synthase QueE [Halobacteriota archaeon]